MLSEQLMTGGCVSLTVTVKEHTAESLSWQVTVVVPTGKIDPEDGVHATSSQSPLSPGAR
jgi:hypothetical protein